MRYLRRALLASACLIVLGSAAHAQGRPQATSVSIPQRVSTYHASVTALAPAASATDFFTLTGSASAVVRVKYVECFGISTANANNLVNLLRRTTANTAGTSTATPIVASDTNDSAATAVVAAYTANPTLGTTVANSFIRSGRLSTVAAATSTLETTPPLRWTFGAQNDKEITLRGATQVLALNGAGASFSAGAALSCAIEWTESPN
jgi:hypothetical protein